MSISMLPGTEHCMVRGALCVSISMLPGTEHCMTARGSVHVYLYVTGY